MDIGTRVFKGYMVGCLGHTVVRAPLDGRVRGIIRDGTQIGEPAGARQRQTRSHWCRAPAACGHAASRGDSARGALPCR
jgi:hypothetical protein